MSSKNRKSYTAYILESSRKRTAPASPRVKRTISVTAAVIALSLAILVLAPVVAGAFYIYGVSEELPRLEREALKPPAQTTKIFAADGTLLADLHSEVNRVVVPLDRISPWMQKAIIAIEDERFYKHKGVDYEAILRSLVVDIRTGSAKQGASTITQQYVRNIYLSPEKTFERKIKEAFLAYQIEKIYSKDTILEKYLNTVYFGQGCYGVETASILYFGKSAKDLTLPEAALLAGLVKAPSRYTPYSNPDLALRRRNIVLKKMLELGYIDAATYEQAVRQKVVVHPLPKHTYRAAPYFVEYVKQLLIDKYGADRVFKGGLRVYTTINLKLQKAAEEAVFSTLDRPKDPAASLVAIEVKTGKILAMVGGKDFEKEKFNLAVQGRRQPGSSFKTFVLVAALEKGISPYETYESSPLTIRLPGQDWKVSNAEGGGGGPRTLRDATIHSINAVYARLVMDVGAEKVVDVAKRMGIRSNIKPFPSIALGSQSVSPLDMASAYATLANGGKRIDPIAYTKITDASGNVIFEVKPKPVQVIEPWIAYTVTDILKGVIRRGTGTRARIFWPAAGKTGTAQEYRDAWFVGYTPEISCAVWVGYKQAQIPLRNIHGFARVYGGTLPAMIWKKFMTVAMEGRPRDDFPRPKIDKNLITVKVCEESGLLATPFCPNVRRQIFLKGKAPKEFCTIHKGIELPDLRGMTRTDAVEFLASKNLKAVVVTQYSTTYPAGIVFEQNPSAGTPLPEGASVTIYVSLGPPPTPPSTETTSAP